MTAASNSQTAGQPAPTSANPASRRASSQSSEGLSLSPDGKTLFVALQSAARQDLANAATRGSTRLFASDIIDLDNIALTSEYAVQLPKFQQGANTLLPALDPDRPNDCFPFVANDNDFATTDGFQVGSVNDDGKDIDTMVFD